MSGLRLCFGCSNLGSDLSAAASRVLVESAFDCGFRHFDTAPSYANGLAEGLLGQALHSVRSEVTIVTKTGIGHPQAAAGLRALRKVALPLKRAFPGLWKTAASQARQRTATRGKFGREDILASVAESLERLGTGYVDVLLLHEVLAEDIADALFATLHILRTRGWVRATGIGTAVPAALEIVTQHPGRFDVVQVNHHWGAFLPALLAGPHRLNTHRWLKSGSRIVAEPAFRRELESDLASALADPHNAPLLLLAAARLQNPAGQLLVSSSKPQRLQEFAAAFRSQEFDPLAARLNIHLARIATPAQADD